MAKILKSNKGFKLIEMSAEENIELNGMGICDYCGTPAREGVYISVINSWYCKRCFNLWHGRAINYTEDQHTEERNFRFYRNLLEIHGCEVSEI